MNSFRIKQKRIFTFMKALIAFSAIFIFIFIGAQPYIADKSETAALVLNYFCNGLVIANLVLIFVYYSKYGKCDGFLTSVEYEINDNGYYFTSRESQTREEFLNTLYDDLKECNFNIDKNITVDDFTFDLRAYKRKEGIYAVDIDFLDNNDIVAYLDEAIDDITVKNLKRKFDAVICFVTDNAQESAIALSKMITPLGRKGVVKVSICIIEPESRRVYFRGNEESVCRKLTASHIMNCKIPIKDEYIHKDKLQFQYDIEEKMKSFNLKDFNNGDFYVH